MLWLEQSKQCFAKLQFSYHTRQEKLGMLQHLSLQLVGTLVGPNPP